MEPQAKPKTPDSGQDPAKRRIGWIAARPPGASDHWLTRFVFLRLLGLVYFVAFVSLANQLVPLIGRHGLLPAHDYLEAIRAPAGAPLFGLPTIFWVSDSDSFMVALAWVGAGLSLAVVLGFANAILMAVLWALYLSFVHVGQVWYGYGWEIQLLETGFLGIFLCPLVDPRPFPGRAPPIQVVWLLRWLAFRIYLGAGLIKIRGDPAWRDLTALATYFETQPIPNPVSRFVHFAPSWFLTLGCLWNHFTELVVPWFVFWPVRVRRVAGALLVFFQVMLIVTGNLSFLNWLTVAPCLSAFDDGVWRRILPRRLSSAADRAIAASSPSRPQAAVAWALFAVVALLSLFPVRNMLLPGQLMNASFNSVHLVNTYGAFGSVSPERYEIVLEGAQEEDSAAATWKEYEWKAKPGDPKRGLPWVAPYHYRIDWQVWFAAMPDARRHVPPWFVHLVWKLLHNDPNALSLLAQNPFGDSPPRYIRAGWFRYRFAQLGSGVVWERIRVDEYLPPLSARDPDLRRYLADRGWLDDDDPFR